MMPSSNPQAPQGGGGDVKAQLISVLKQLRAAAEQQGINFQELVAEVMGGGAGQQTPPRPPSVPMQ